MAGLYLRGKNHDRAVLAMRSACLLEPKNADSWAQMAVVYYRAGKAGKSAERLSDARSAARKSLEIDPGGPAREILEMIEAEEKGLGQPADSPPSVGENAPADRG